MRVICFCLALLCAHTHALSIALVVPTDRPQPFWQLLSRSAEASANDLGVEVEVVLGGFQRFSQMKAIKTLIERENKPDFIVFRHLPGNATTLFKMIDHADIPFVTLERPYTETELKDIGYPRGKFKNWIGEIDYNNQQAGQILAQALVDEAKSRAYFNNHYSIIAIGGTWDPLSRARENGLASLANSSSNVVVKQTFYSNWNPAQLEPKFEHIVLRYPDTYIYWAVGGELAVSTSNQLMALKKEKYERFIVGGFDWTPEAIELVQEGKLSAVVGGHFLLGALAVLKIYDYSNKIDVFSSDDSEPAFVLEVVDRNNAEELLWFYKEDRWSDVDFQQFSKFKTAPNPAVDLSMKAILKSLQKNNPSK